MRRIGRAFPLKTDHLDGCQECKRVLLEDDTVAYVDGKLTCKACVQYIIDKTAIGKEMKRRGTI